MQFLIDLVEMVAGRLEEAAQSDVVVGEAIVLGAVTIVPLSRLSIGFGGGGGEGEGDVPEHHGRRRGKAGRGKGTGGGVAMGAKVRPVGVALFSEDGVEVVPIADKKGLLDKIFDRVPDVLDLIKKAQEKG